MDLREKIVKMGRGETNFGSCTMPGCGIRGVVTWGLLPEN
jgi:hypothetical protein